MKSRRNTNHLLSSVILLAAGTAIGWILSVQYRNLEMSNKPPLRLEGYTYTNPLLVCDTESKVYGELDFTDDLNEKIASFPADSKISIYYRDLLSGTSAEINTDEKYYPASLSKIPAMIAAFKMGDADPDFLNRKIVWDDKTDYNALQAIKPEKSLEYGREYSIAEAVELMIRYSDNNAFYLIAKAVDPAVFKQTFTDLRIPLREDPNSPEDFITAEQFSYFFRVLYNGTYLRKSSSERALKMLTEVDYKDGILAGIPADNIEVAHKFGLASNLSADKEIKELHDCGIVYKEDKPYLLCIMTKSKESIDEIEMMIREVSSIVYNKQ